MVVVKAHFCIAAQKLGKEIVLICNTRALLMEQKSTPGLHKGHILTLEPLVQKNHCVKIKAIPNLPVPNYNGFVIALKRFQF